MCGVLSWLFSIRFVVSVFDSFMVGGNSNLVSGVILLLMCICLVSVLLFFLMSLYRFSVLLLIVVLIWLKLLICSRVWVCSIGVVVL